MPTKGAINSLKMLQYSQLMAQIKTKTYYMVTSIKYVRVPKIPSSSVLRSKYPQNKISENLEIVEMTSHGSGVSKYQGLVGIFDAPKP